MQSASQTTLKHLSTEELNRLTQLASEAARLKLEIHNVSLDRKRILERGRQRRLRDQ